MLGKQIIIFLFMCRVSFYRLNTIVREAMSSFQPSAALTALVPRSPFFARESIMQRHQLNHPGCCIVSSDKYSCHNDCSFQNE